MVKKFRMPPPIGSGQADQAHVVIGSEQVDCENKMRFAVRKSGLMPLHTAVCKRLFFDLEHGLAGADSAIANRPSNLESNLSVIAFLYIGRRIGNLEVRFSGCDEGLALNDAGAVMSTLLTELRDSIGEKQATQVFRRLETITGEVLEQEFGRSR
jgi:hypothetical protein